MSQFRLGIEASNLREGGGLTHLVELLRAAEPAESGIGQVVVWAGEKTLSSLPEKAWLLPKTDPLLNTSLPAWIYWHRYILPKVAEQNCDILFVPGGTYLASFRPYVTLSQNILPFEQNEYRRYGISWMTLKMILLRFSQGRTFQKANGMIFLNESARSAVMDKVKTLEGEWTIIPHGMSQAFRLPPRPAKPITGYSQTTPFRLLYVSNVYPYKHQWNVAEAVHLLRQAGMWIELDLVGSAYSPALDRLRNVIQRIDPEENYIHYHGTVPYAELPGWYQRADGFVFASSCECFSISLLEAMAAGLPIACSNRGPMPEQLGEAGIYFDPECKESIAEALACLIQDNNWREKHAPISFTRAQSYTWERCARETFDFIAQIAKKYDASTKL